MERIGRYVWVVVMLTVLSGCTTIRVVSSVESELVGQEQRVRKNYELGRKQAVVTGEAVVRVEDVGVERYQDRVRELQATEDFVISGGEITMRGKGGETYAVRADAILGRNTYRVVDIPGPSLEVYSALIDDQGRVQRNALIRDKVSMWFVSVQPPEVRFRASEKGAVREVIVSGSTYELLYGGTDGKTLSLTYREYAAGELSQPAFFQNLLYAADSEFIRFRHMKIRVHEATGERLVFSVIEDGITR